MDALGTLWYFFCNVMQHPISKKIISLGTFLLLLSSYSPGGGRFSHARQDSCSSKVASFTADYDFFVAHTTEKRVIVENLVRIVKSRLQPSGKVEVLDFGSARGALSEALIQNIEGLRERTTFSVVEPEATFRKDSVSRLGSYSRNSVRAWKFLPAKFQKRFHIVLANHVLYYIDDFNSVNKRILGSLADGGVYIITLSNEDSSLVKIIESLGESQRASYIKTLEKSLDSLGAQYSYTQVQSELKFPDSIENRKRVLRFMFGNDYDTYREKTLLASFERYRVNENIVLPLSDNIYEIRNQR